MGVFELGIQIILFELNIHYLIDTDADQSFDTFYNSILILFTETSLIDGKIRIDMDNDGILDYPYSEGSISNFDDGFPLIYVMISVIIIPIIVIAILFKKGIIFLYEEEYLEEE